jgi:hypothetical protein
LVLAGGAVFAQKAFAMLRVVESFRPTRAGDGKRSRDISGLEASFDISSSQVLVQKSGIKTISGADWIDNFEL